ncbi:MAG TPA: protoporphyrinogen oxidase [Anaerolineales bacterium]|nr:protoporphyrinogen oxidase [Anaerolineales bacterium]
MKHLIIIGGGIAGLAAAYYVRKQARGALKITLLEQADYWGGKLVTERVKFGEGRFVIEGGPDTFVVTKPWGVKLCKELGIAERLKGTNPETKKTYILKNGELHELPGGLTMMIPTEFGPMIRTGLLSWLAKIRMGLDFLLPPASVNGDETLGAFVTRRLGRAAYENLIEPLMSGIYAGDGDQLSLQATFPYLRDLELEHGGLVKGALALRRERMRKARANGSSPSPTPGSRSIFLTPMTGLAEIVEALIHQLESCGVDLRLRTTVQKVIQEANRYSVRLAKGEALTADQVILATPSFVTADLVSDFAPDLAVELRSIDYVSTATVTLAYRESDLPRPLDGYGYVIPRREGRKALACTWTSTKFPHRAPEGFALLRVFIGRAGQEGEIAWDESALLRFAQEELRLTLDITAKPLLWRNFTWEKAMPQYNLGHPERLERIERRLAAYPGLALAGNAYQGIGIPDCIHSGELAAEKILSTWQDEPPSLKEMKIDP